MPPNPDGDTLMHEGATPPSKDLAERKHELKVKRRGRKKRTKERLQKAELSMDIDNLLPATSMMAHQLPTTDSPTVLPNGTTIASITTAMSRTMRLHSPESSHSNDADDEDLDILTPEERLKLDQRNAARRERVERRDRVKARQAEGILPPSCPSPHHQSITPRPLTHPPTEEAQTGQTPPSLAEARNEDAHPLKLTKQAKYARRKTRRAEKKAADAAAKEAEMVEQRETAQEQMRVAAAKRKALKEAEVSKVEGTGERKRRGRDEGEDEDLEWEAEGLGFKRLRIWEG